MGDEGGTGEASGGHLACGKCLVGIALLDRSGFLKIRACSLYFVKGGFGNRLDDAVRNFGTLQVLQKICVRMEADAVGLQKLDEVLLRHLVTERVVDVIVAERASEL